MSSHFIYLIFFCFNLIVSSLINTPLPLYGSGFLQFLTTPAKLMSTSRSGPSSRMRVSDGVVTVTPLGMPTSTGCVKPSLRQRNFWPGYCSFAPRCSTLAR